MTEDEWLKCEEPRRAFGFLFRRGSDRKWRLFACACCRTIWDRFPSPRNRELVAVVEDNPDADFNDPTLHAALRASSDVEREFSDDPVYWAAKYLGRGFYKIDAATSALVVTLRGGVAGATQVRLFRDIFGNPFRPVTADPAWLTSDVLLLARGINQEKAFDRMPILADALQDAGCDNDEILNHCRAEGWEHVRGCWVIDLLLGRQWCERQ